MTKENIAELAVELIDFLTIAQKLGYPVMDIRKELMITGTVSPYEVSHIGYGKLESVPNNEKMLISREYNEMIEKYIKQPKKKGDNKK